MRMNIFLPATISLLLAATAAYACPKQLPEGLAGVAVGQDLVTNGLAMSITQVEGRESVIDVLKRTEKTWKDAGYQVKRSNAAGWEIVSALSNTCMVTLQLISRNGAFGYLARSRTRIVNAMTPQSAGAPIPDDAKVTSSVASDDDGRKGLTLSMTSARSPDDLNRFFMEQLKESHWGAIRSQVFKYVKPQDTSSILVSAQRDRKRIEIVIWPEQETQIVMTISDAL